MFPACRKRQKIKLEKTLQTARQSMTMFFHQQLCSPGTLIWQCVTWTRSFRCLRPNTPLSSPHRLKVSPIGKHKLSMCLFLSGGSAGIWTSILSLHINKSSAGEPTCQCVCGWGRGKGGFVCQWGLGETGTFPLNQLIFTSVQFGQTNPRGFKEAVGSLCACFRPHGVM